VILKLVVKGFELMPKGFKLGVKLNVGHFSADLSEGYSYLLENLILGILIIFWEELVEEVLILISILGFFHFFVTLSYCLQRI
jgi:hypothetical protein